MTVTKRIWLILVTLALVIASSVASAHKASDSFLYLDSGPAELRIDVALRDLALLTGIDPDGDRQVSGRELRQARPEITRTVEAALSLSNTSGICTLSGREWGISEHSDGSYAAARYAIECPDGEPPVELEYNILFEQDALHRGLVSLDQGGQARLAVLGPDARTLDLASEDSAGYFGVFTTFVYEGVIHLLIGLDHILFLLVLIIPATLATYKSNHSGTEAPSLRARLIDLAGIITAFTAAHSITLALAALNIVALPIGWVETVIALSIALAVLNVVWPVLGHKTWKLAFGFGLVHGFGFASVLGDLTSGVSGLAVALAGFNLGVELGQLALLVLGFPILYYLGKSQVYRQAAVPVVLAGIGAISLYWVVQRAPLF
ncbi:HupE / UreJ protein [Marinobacter sp. es.048]|uniref:HupE/UreJ family protein n=1 Tax=Marinobacter sp. es.048 TaxID=1761795 RepID=UPI000B6DE6D4|nr:HupE/UreJ family protein [Marinobacter sp. es.048]SNC60889.1 HupE / UreJ protein [Marinobacter sp. es.048]